MQSHLIGFDDYLIERVFNPVAEWLFSSFGISNFRLARYLCTVTMLVTLYGISYYLGTGRYIDALCYLIVLVVFVRLRFISLRVDDRGPPGTVSPFRPLYLPRLTVFGLNIVTSFASLHLFTMVISNLAVLTFYFMACDRPRGDRLAFKTDPI